jgi:hypothetical protein
MTKGTGLPFRGLGKWCSLVVAAVLCAEALWTLTLQHRWVQGGVALSLGVLLAYATILSKRWASSLNLVIGFLLIPALVIDLLGARPIFILAADVLLFVLAGLSFYLLNREARALAVHAA